LPQFNIGSVRGGISRTYDRSRPALMPDRCTVTVDIRVVPGMDKDSIMQDLTQLLDDIARGDPDFAYELEFASDTFPHPFNSPEDSPVATAIGRAHKRVTGQPAAESKILRFAASDASWMAKAGIPGIVYGPTGRYLSRPDERGRIEDLVTATKVYSCLIADLCSPDQHNGV
jgi:acetylornithine deacetylase